MSLSDNLRETKRAIRGVPMLAVIGNATKQAAPILRASVYKSLSQPDPVPMRLIAEAIRQRLQAIKSNKPPS